jgi:hypothetical protein
MFADVRLYRHLSPGEAALQQAGLMAEPWVNAAAIGTGVVVGAPFAIGVGGAAYGGVKVLAMAHPTAWAWTMAAAQGAFGSGTGTGWAWMVGRAAKVGWGLIFGH